MARWRKYRGGGGGAGQLEQRDDGRPLGLMSQGSVGQRPTIVSASGKRIRGLIGHPVVDCLSISRCRVYTLYSMCLFAFLVPVSSPPSVSNLDCAFFRSARPPVSPVLVSQPQPPVGCPSRVPLSWQRPLSTCPALCHTDRSSPIHSARVRPFQIRAGRWDQSTCSESAQQQLAIEVDSIDAESHSASCCPPRCRSSAWRPPRLCPPPPTCSGAPTAAAAAAHTSAVQRAGASPTRLSSHHLLTVQPTHQLLAESDQHSDGSTPDHRSADNAQRLSSSAMFSHRQI